MDKARIIVAEDEAIVAFNIADQLKKMDYNVVAIVVSGEQALEKTIELKPDLLLMDIQLAGKIDGIEAANEIKKIANIPVVYLTAFADEKTLSRAKITDPSGYVLKPMDNKQLHVSIEMALHRQDIDLNLRNNHTMIYSSMRGMIEGIAGTIELRGPYTEGHHKRVGSLAVAIAREMKLTDFQIEGIGLASSIFDIGMVNIPADILQDAERLEGLKLSMYQTYPEAAYKTLKKIECIWPIADITFQHRECYDGSGFPRGIKGEEILIEARILAVAVAVEDLTTHRSYRNAFPLSDALEKISSGSGSQFDPDVVAACLSLFKKKGYKLEG